MGEQPEWGKKISVCFIIPQRVIMSIMAFFAIVNAYTMRICLSVTITELVVKKNHSAKTSAGATVCLQDETLFSNTTSRHPINEGGIYEWDEELQGFILASFYIGYVVTHIPGGLLADKLGGKWVLSLGILSTAVFTLITPIALKWGDATALIWLRILMGAGEGTTFPAISTLIAQWIPRSERGKLGSLVLGGGQIGTIFGNTITGLILHNTTWDWVFYFWGIVAIFWFITFSLLCYSDPEDHPFIKEREKEYLKAELFALGVRRDLPPTPWRMIFTSWPMFALLNAQIGHDWGFFIIVTDLPKYMADVMQFNVKDNGIYSSLPFVAMWIISVGSGFMADWIINSGTMSVTNTRKTMTTMAAVGPGFFMVCASYAGCNRLAVVILFIVCMASMGTYYAGMKLNPLDLSPNYAGILMAITNGIGALTGIITPYLVGVLTPNTTMEEWRVVFWIAFIVLTFTAIVYCIWASGEIQPFNDPPRKEPKDQ